MEALFAVLAGLLVAGGVFLIVQRNLIRVVFGIILLSNAVNLIVITAGRITRARPPLIPADAYAPAEAVANPLPQALVLTAIVIGFGLVVFTLVLLLRGFLELGTVHIGELPEVEESDEDREGREREEGAA